MDTELGVGESRLEFLGGYAGERDLPLPSTLPPPSFRADMSPKGSFGSRHGFVQASPFPIIVRRRDLPIADNRLCKRYLIHQSIFAFANDLASLKSHNMPEEFPAVEGGGSLILAWQIRNKRVLVVGGGEVSPGTFPFDVISGD